MTTRSWAGESGNWYNSLLWSTSLGGSGIPGPGDVAVVNSGTVDISGADESANELPFPVDAVHVTLGSAVIAATEATFGNNVIITSNAAGAVAALDTTGPTGFSGTISAGAAGGTFSIEATQADGTQAASFVLLHGGLIDVSGGDDLILTGSMVSDSGVTITAGSTFTNDGTDRLFGGTTMIDPGATLTGTGTFEAGPGGTLYFESPVPATQTVVFGEAGRVDLTSPSTFLGQFTAFVQGNTIDLLNIVANEASYDASSGLLTIDNGATLVAELLVQGPTADLLLNTASDGAGGTLITYPGSSSRTSYEITVAAQAVQSNVVNQTMTTAAGAPITGAGITIGIMSDSFNATLSGVVDPADTAAQLGYLPATAQGKSAVNVLQDSTISGVENEGLAMAELVHQIAPGATIDFYTAEGGQASFAQGVASLQAAGCNIIVDDWSFSATPFYQVAGPVDTAVENAISAGVDYFTSASNFGDSYYENTWQPMSAQLVLQNGQPAQPVQAQEFSNGTALQTITVPGSMDTTIGLEWDAAWPTAAGSVTDPLKMVLYNANTGSIVAQSAIDTSYINLTTTSQIPEIYLTVDNTGSASANYELAIIQNGTTSVPSGLQFKYILFGSPASADDGAATPDDGGTVSAADPGGVIDDPQAGQGSGDVHGQELVPGVDTVGASYWSTSPALGVSPDWTEYFSSVGPGELLFDQNGNPLATPESAGKVDFVAPDGIQTSIPNFQAFFGTSAAAPDAAAVAALMLQANPSLTPSQVTSLLEQSAVSMSLPSADQGAGLIQATTAVQLALEQPPPCFCAGTRILTERGEVAVEDLRIGDRVPTVLGGTTTPIVWIGHRSVEPTRHPRPHDVWPVRIAAHAFNPGVPCRDLWLSPDHAVFIDGVLIPVRYLVNGRTIVQEPVGKVTYWHVELARHDVLLADALPCESYLDTGNRGAFDNGTGPATLHPDFALRVWAADACARLVTDGAERVAARSFLLERAGQLGHVFTRDPELRLRIGGRQLRPAAVGQSHSFELPCDASNISLVSRRSVPAQVEDDSDDCRRLGVAVSGIRLDGASIALNDSRLGRGWHDLEGGGAGTRWRWTNGEAELLLAGGRTLEIDVVMTARYWAREEMAQARAA